MLNGGCSPLTDLDELASTRSESPPSPHPSQDSLISVETSSSAAYAANSLRAFKSGLSMKNVTHGSKRPTRPPYRAHPSELKIMPCPRINDALPADLSSPSGSSIPSDPSEQGPMYHGSMPFPTVPKHTSSSSIDSARFLVCAEAGPGPGTISARKSKSWVFNSTPDQPTALSTKPRRDVVVDDLESDCSEDESCTEQALSLGSDMTERRRKSTPLEARSFTRVDSTTPVSAHADSRLSTRSRRLPKFLRQSDDGVANEWHHGISHIPRAELAEEEIVVTVPTGVSMDVQSSVPLPKVPHASEASLPTELLRHEPLPTPLSTLPAASGSARVKRGRPRKTEDSAYSARASPAKRKTKRILDVNSEDVGPSHPAPRKKRARKTEDDVETQSAMVPPVLGVDVRNSLGPQTIAEQVNNCTQSGRSKRVRRKIFPDSLDDTAFERLLDGGWSEMVSNERLKGQATSSAADTPSLKSVRIDNLSKSGSRAALSLLTEVDGSGKSASVESTIRTSLTGRTQERQAGTCLAVHYAPYPKCTACIERTTGDPCRFRSFRVFPINPETREVTGSPYFASQLAISSEPSLRTTFNVSFGYEHVQRTKSAVNSVVLGIITDELRHVVANQALIRDIGVDHRALCDFCSSTIFGGNWFCTLCGRDFCGLCEQLFPPTNHNEDDHTRTLDAVAVDRLLRCTAAGVNHSRKIFRAVSHFSKCRLQTYWVEIASSIIFDRGPLLNSLGRCPAPARFRHLLDAAGFTPSPPPSPPLFQPKLYRTQTDSDHQLPSDPAGLRAVSHPFMVFDSAAVLSDAIFDEVWGRGEPIVVRGCLTKLRLDWTPEGFTEQYGQQTCQIVDCQTNEILSMTVSEFFNSFGKHQQRHGVIRKLKDWPPTSDFMESFPDLYDDFNGALPVSNYTRRDGVMNISAHFPDGPSRPDLGPKMYIANAALESPGGHGSTRLHMDMADAINIMVYAAPDAQGGPGCAVWDVFRASDADRIRAFLRRKFAGRYTFVDPIHSQLFYLDSDLRLELAETMEVVSWRIYQYPGQAVFIPAGCAHQVCNLADCMKIAMDFVSPHNIQRCRQLTDEFRKENFQDVWKDDVLQLHNVMWYAWFSSQAAEKRLAQLTAQHSASSVPDEGDTIPTSPAANVPVPQVTLAQKLLGVLLADALPKSSSQSPTPTMHPASPLAAASADIAMEDAAGSLPKQVIESMEQQVSAPTAVDSYDQSIKRQSPLVPQKDDQTNRLTDTVSPVPQAHTLKTSADRPNLFATVNTPEGVFGGLTNRMLPLPCRSLSKLGQFPAGRSTCLKPLPFNSPNPVIVEASPPRERCWPHYRRPILPYGHPLQQRDAGFHTLDTLPPRNRQEEVRSLTASDQLFNNRGRLWNERSVAVPVFNDLDPSTGRQMMTSQYASAVETDAQRRFSPYQPVFDRPYPRMAEGWSVATASALHMRNPEDERGASGVGRVGAMPYTSVSSPAQAYPTFLQTAPRPGQRQHTAPDLCSSRPLGAERFLSRVQTAESDI